MDGERRHRLGFVSGSEYHIEILGISGSIPALLPPFIITYANRSLKSCIIALLDNMNCSIFKALHMLNLYLENKWPPSSFARSQTQLFAYIFIPLLCRFIRSMSLSWTDPREMLHLVRATFLPYLCQRLSFSCFPDSVDTLLLLSLLHFARHSL